MVKSIFPSSNSKKRWRALGATLMLVTWVYMQDYKSLPENYGRQLLVGTRSVEYPIPDTKVKPYDNLGVIETQKQLEYLQPLLIFDGSDNTFKSFVANQDNSRRISVPYLITYGLRRFFPERFQKGKPSFQVMFDTTDKIPSTCVVNKEDEKCHTDEWAPYLFFGTVTKDEAAFPSVKAFPTPSFLSCFLNLDCGIFAIQENPPTWDDLIPTIIWRGSDHGFFHTHRAMFFGVDVPRLDKETATKQLMEHWDEMTPRWRGVMLSMFASQEEVPWIDVKFPMSQEKLDDCRYISYCSYNKKFEFEFATSHYMGEEEQIKYKYHIDLGGGGGTTWTGTYRKLGMPGVLFHHETIMKDWFFDEIKPWVHYIPVEWDLTDLKQKYEWAEAHPEECQAISKRATDFFLDFRSRENVQDMYHRLFHTYLGKVVEAYVPAENESVQDILDSYKNQEGLDEKMGEFYPFGTCDEEECISHVGLHTLKYEDLDQQHLTQGGKQPEENAPKTNIDLDTIMVSEELDMIDELLKKSQHVEQVDN